MRVVLFFDGGPLLLDDVKRHADGTIRTGYVENGCWNFECRGGEMLAKDGNWIVNRSPVPDTREFVVPEDWTGNYQEIIDRARETTGETL